MEVFLFLIPFTLLIIIIMLIALFWALRNNQYEDLKGEGERILFHQERSKELAKKKEIS